MSPRRRAYVLPMVILLALMGTLVVAVCMERFGSQRLLVQRQIEEYKRHHEMLGAQTVIRQWIGRQQPQALLAFSKSADPSHRFALPENVRIAIWVRDGQGGAKVDLTQEIDPKRSWFEAILWRLPEERPELLRRVGPAEISVNAAPREVLRALREGGDPLADSILTERSRGPITREQFRRLLDTAGVSPEEAIELQRLVTFEPVLYRLVVEASDGDDPRLFTALFEFAQNKTTIHEWRELSDPAVAREYLGDAATLLLTPETRDALAESETAKALRSR
ncbi:MAG: hypothetical protein IBJ10_04195 [Phycisphaerales bacterium]|nr:hypothetical protein [Phycisphaerales bacterium]